MMADIHLLLAGDFCPVGRLQSSFDWLEAERKHVTEELAVLTHRTDCFVVNVECPLTNIGKEIKKAGRNLRANPGSVRLLQDLQVGLVVLANNHIMDFDEEGLSETLDSLGAAGIQTVGAGMDREDARRIHYREIQGRTVAVVSMADCEFSCATRSRGGGNPFDITVAVQAIRDARKQADHVLLILHGGLEATHYPSPKSVKTMRFLAEERPTAIIRHHPHRVQGHEIWQGVPIFYSLGNFLFDWLSPLKDEGWYEGIVVELSIDRKDQCSIAVHPFEQCKEELRIRMLDGRPRDRFLERYKKWSVTIESESALRREWLSLVESRRREYLGLLALPHPFLVRVARRLGLSNHLRPLEAKRRIFESFLQCDAHREVLLEILERDRKEENEP